MTQPPSEPSGSDGPESPTGDHGLTPAGDRGHGTYALGKSADGVELHKIRNPEQWRTELDRWGNRRELHDAFMLGSLALSGRTAEQGWEHEVSLKTPEGLRRLDAARVLHLPNGDIIERANEFKAGWTPAEEGLLQLRKEGWLLSRGVVRQSEYTVRDLSDMDPEVLAKARELEQQYPGRFLLREAGEVEFERAVAAGRPILAKLAQVRLHESIEQLRAVPELAVARDAIAKFDRDMQAARERSEQIPLHVLVGAHNDLRDLIEADRELTRRTDDIALKRADLLVRQALTVEQAQIFTRQQRHENLTQALEPLAREITARAVEVARKAQPDLSRDREKLKAKAQDLHRRSLDEKSREDELARDANRLEHQQQTMREMERDAEREALQRQGLIAVQIEQAQQVLDKERQVREREANEALERTRVLVKARSRETEMARTIKEHNATIAAAARPSLEQVQTQLREVQKQGSQVRIREKEQEIARIQDAARRLQLTQDDARNLDAKVYREFLAGRERFDHESGQWVVSIEGHDRQLRLANPERIAAQSARLAQQGQDPRMILNTNVLQPPMPPVDANRYAARDTDESRAREQDAREQKARERDQERAAREAEQRERGW